MSDIYPSLIAADQLHLADAIAALDPYCAGYHLDVMDNHLVPNLTMGPLWVNEIAKATDRTIWVHLMADNPANLIEQFCLAPGSLITIHREAPIDHEAMIATIRKKGWRPGIAINPQTAVSTLEPLLDAQIDHVLIMSVEPGFFGQTFIEATVPKIDILKKIRTDKKLPFAIGMDGGINEKNIKGLREKGATLFAVATGIFGGSNMIKNIQKLQ